MCRIIIENVPGTRFEDHMGAVCSQVTGRYGGIYVDRAATNNRKLAFGLDIIIFFLSFYLSYGLVSIVKGQPAFLGNLTTYYETQLFVLVAWSAAAFLMAEYPVRRLTALMQDVDAAVRVSITGLVFFILIDFTVKFPASRLFTGFYFLDTTCAMIVLRALVRGVLGYRRKSGRDVRTRLLVGGGEPAAQYIDSIELRPQVGIRIVGQVTDEGAVNKVPQLGTVEDLVRVLSSVPVDGVVIALPLRDARVECVVAACEEQGIPIELMLDGLSSRIKTGELVHGGGMSRLVLTMTPHAGMPLALKRVTDVVVSLLALIVLLPVMVAIMLAVKLDSGGPVLFTQQRVGRYGRPFAMHKFRSMSVDAEAQLVQLLEMNEMSGPVFKIGKDPRITRVGRFLRRTSMDELPQLWDVLVGKMSLVGPRPPIPAEVNQYDPHHRRRLSVKPGITCLWQISGRNQISDFDRWVDLDLAYIDSWSYMNDWKIIFRTIPVLWKRTGA